MNSRVADKGHKKRIKIALLTPYTGGNLGDGAIQDAVIANIRSRLPKTDIIGITLCPRVTELIHDIPCFPLTAMHLRHYAPSGCSSGGASHTGDAGKQRRRSNVRAIVKKIVYASKILTELYHISKAAIGPVKRLGLEIRHCRDVYHVLGQVDLLIVAGGGQLDDYWGGPWGHPFSLAKWSCLATMRGTRILFLSVGMCMLESRMSHRFIRYALGKSVYRSYRDEGSKQLLRTMAFTRNDPVIPDLAFSYRCGKSSAGEVRIGSRNTVGISPMVYLADQWPKRDRERYEDYLNELAEFTEELLGKGYEVRLFTSDENDIAAVHRLISIMETKGISADGVKFSALDTLRLDSLFEALDRFDFVVASRLHGVILSHIASKPTLAISYDRKVEAYMNSVDQSPYCVDISAFNASLLCGVFDRMVSDRDGIRHCLRMYMNRFASKLQEQYDHVLGARRDRHAACARTEQSGLVYEQR